MLSLGLMRDGPSNDFACVDRGAADRPGNGRRGWRAMTILLVGSIAMTTGAVAQVRSMVPVTVDGSSVELAVFTYKPAGTGPFPTLIFHHGSTGKGTDSSSFAQPHLQSAMAQWFTARGWAVLLPQRRGRGGSQGLYDEGFGPVRASGYTCTESAALAGAERALRDVDAITPVLLAMPFVDRSKVAVGGVSRGGILSVAWSGRQPAVPQAVINFVGGWMAVGCSTTNTINGNLFSRGGASVKPSIWLYGDSDPYYPLAHSRSNFSIFQAAGGKGAFHEFAPPSGKNGHFINTWPELWSGTMEAYLTSRGLPAKAR